MYGLYARKHHKVEMRGDVTDAGRTTERTITEDRATQPMEAGGWVSQKSFGFTKKYCSSSSNHQIVFITVSCVSSTDRLIQFSISLKGLHSAVPSKRPFQSCSSVSENNIFCSISLWYDLSAPWHGALGIVVTWDIVQAQFWWGMDNGPSIITNH